jgi:hypothetical protein
MKVEENQIDGIEELLNASDPTAKIRLKQCITDFKEDIANVMDNTSPDRFNVDD